MNYQYSSQSLDCQNGFFDHETIEPDFALMCFLFLWQLISDIRQWSLWHEYIHNVCHMGINFKMYHGEKTKLSVKYC